MRIAIGNISHESSSFTPVPTPYENFAGSKRGFFRGDEIVEQLEGVNMGCGGFIQGAREYGFELAPLLWTYCMPSGPIESNAWQRLKGEFLDRLSDAMPVDGALFDLHGAMAVEDIEDGEGDLLTGVREILGPDRPVMATLDLHANITQRMVDMTQVLLPCDRNPHTDLGERGYEAAGLMVKTLRKEIRPVMAWRQLPMFWGRQQISGHQPFESVTERAHAIEAKPGVLTCSVAPGFLWADIHDAGTSVVVVADGDRELAQREADDFGSWIYERRAEFQSETDAWEDVLAESRARGRWPVVIADQQDNPGGGAPGDSTGMLRAFIEAGLEDALIAVIWDPESAAAAHAAGAGGELTLDVGGKSDPKQGPPVRMSAQVERLTDGGYVNRGPMFTEVRQEMGPSTLLRCGGVRIIVGSERHQALDAECPRSFGIEPTQLRWIGIKSSNHFRASYEPFAEAVYRVSFPSVQPHDPHQLTYRNLRRPIWPLDQ